MCSYLQQKDFVSDSFLWISIINHTHPEAFVQIHIEYIDAGADIITSNTFRPNPVSLSKAGISSASEFVKQAIEVRYTSMVRK
jgi:homocysteine S-methyltransferase